MHFLALISHKIIFFCRGEQANLVNEGCSEKSYKIIWKTVGMDYFLSKVLDLQPTNFLTKKRLCHAWSFQSNLSLENVLVAASLPGDL